MAETYSTEYTNSYISSPSGHNYAQGGALREFYFSYTQVLGGTAADTILLCKLPPQSTLIMLKSYFEWATFTATATLSIGWKAYVDVDGATQALSAAGLLSSLLLTTAGTWHGGMLLATTPDDSLPVVNRKVFSNREEVTIYATIGVEVPGVAATLSGHFIVVTP